MRRKKQVPQVEVENATITNFFESVNEPCSCSGCNPPEEKCPRLNFNGEVFHRDLNKLCNLYKNKNVPSWVQQYLPPKFEMPQCQPSSFGVPPTLFKEDIGKVTRVIGNQNEEHKTVIEFAKEDARKLMEDGGLLYKFKEDQFQQTDQTDFWQCLSNKRHGDVFMAPGTNTPVKIAISWIRVTMIKEFLYQCDGYVPISFAHPRSKTTETGELIQLTIRQISTMMQHWFPLCQENPLRATVQFFSRLRMLCAEKNGEIHIPYLVLDTNIQLDGDSSLGFKWDKIPTPLTEVLKKKVYGINTAYSYVAILGSFFQLHAEDSNLNSTSVHYGGLAKVWFVMNANATKFVHAKLHEAVPIDAAGIPTKHCIIQHKTTLVDPELLRKWAGNFKIFIQKSGCVIFTGSGCLHQGLNTGNGIAKAANLAFQDILIHATIFARILSDCKCRKNSKFVMTEEETQQLHTKLKEDTYQRDVALFSSREEVTKLVKSQLPNVKNVHACTQASCVELISAQFKSKKKANKLDPDTDDNTKEEPESMDTTEAVFIKTENEMNGDGPTPSTSRLCSKKMLKEVVIGPSTLNKTIGRPTATGQGTYHFINWKLYERGKSYECPTCKKNFGTKKLWMKHSRVHMEDQNAQYVCELCKRVYQSREGCKNHFRNAHKHAVYTCQTCDATFQTDNSRKHHQKKCSG